MRKEADGEWRWSTVSEALSCDDEQGPQSIPQSLPQRIPRPRAGFANNRKAASKGTGKQPPASGANDPVLGKQPPASVEGIDLVPRKSRTETGRLVQKQSGSREEAAKNKIGRQQDIPEHHHWNPPLSGQIPDPQVNLLGTGQISAPKVNVFAVCKGAEVEMPEPNFVPKKDNSGKLSDGICLSVGPV